MNRPGGIPQRQSDCPMFAGPGQLATTPRSPPARPRDGPREALTLSRRNRPGGKSMRSLSCPTPGGGDQAVSSTATCPVCSGPRSMMSASREPVERLPDRSWTISTTSSVPAATNRTKPFRSGPTPIPSGNDRTGRTSPAGTATNVERSGASGTVRIDPIRDVARVPVDACPAVRRTVNALVGSARRSVPR